MKICIIGAGHIGHALVVMLANKGHEINMLSSHLKNVDEIVGYYEDNTIVGRVNKISDKPEEVVSEAELIILSVPAFARLEVLKRIKDHIRDDAIIGAMPGIAGFDLEIDQVLGGRDNLTVFSAQRVPCIARIIEPGKSVRLYIKKSMAIAVNENKAVIKNLLENLLGLNIYLLDSFLEVNLSNSNPILHSARLYRLFKDYKLGIFYPEPISFYELWDDLSSEILIEMDNEFMEIVNKLGLNNIKSLKEHYEVRTVSEMTQKIKSIKAFKGIYAPMIKVDQGYIPNFNSRYFTEDVEFGLKFNLEYGLKLCVDVNVMSKVYKCLHTKIDLNKLFFFQEREGKN